MTERIERMYAKLQGEKVYTFCAEKHQIVVDSWRKHEGLTPVLKRAQATADYFDKRTLYVDDDELIVGNVAAKPNGLEASVWGPFWDDADLDSIIADGKYIISDEDRKALRDCDSFWDEQDRQMYEWQGRFYDDERLWPFIRSGVLCPPWTDKRKGRGSGGAGYGWGLGIGLSFFVPDYGKIITEGVKHTLDEAREELRNVRYVDNDSYDKACYLQAVIIALEAVVRMYHRYGDTCQAAADKCFNPIRKAELEKMAEVCHWIAENPSRDFVDAIQNFWFYWMMITHGTAPLGRFDQFMYPFYKKSKENGMTDADILEYIECLRIKVMQFNFVSGNAKQRDKWAGMARWNNCVIGGVDENGNDATNELSYLILDSAYEIRTPHFTITIRVNENTPLKLIHEGMKVVKTGLGMPAFVSDKSYIQGLLNQGVNIVDARNYALAGCLDMNIPGKSKINALGMFICPKVLEFTMYNGIMTSTGEQVGLKTGEMKDFKTFEDFYEAYKKQLYHFMSMYNEEHNILIRVTQYINPDVLHSAFCYDGIKSGKDMQERSMPYENSSMMNPVGMICVVNSMAAIKKLVFEDKKYTMEEMYNAIEADWVGYEEMLADCKAAPKFGNDDDRADRFAVDLYRQWVDNCNSFTSVHGAPPRPTGISITAYAPGGAITCATPDGRRKGETLPDGVVSPQQGTDKNGPTISLKSAMKIDQDSFNAMLLNMKMSPSALKSDEDLDKLGALVKTYLTNGGKHIQFNVVDNKTLQAAQEKPKEYSDLVVRVAGYSTYYTLLTKTVQDELITRTTNTMI
jgi:pyruvate formate-lyase/glycerol dehydratase family glycyl radical enzyme